MLSIKPYLKEIKYQKEGVVDAQNYPFNIPFLQKLEKIEFHADVTFIVGENGAGKSTLIEAIAQGLGFSKEGGTKNFNLDTADTTSQLHRYFKLIKGFKKPSDYYFLRAESFYNVATYMDEVGYLKEYGGKSLHQQSHGESFFSVINNKLQGRGLYIFDEPEAALSPNRQLAAISAIHELVQNDSQFIIATHSPIIMAYPNAKILLLNGLGIQEVAFEETEHFQTYDLFFKNHKGLIHNLIKGE